MRTSMVGAVFLLAGAGAATTAAAVGTDTTGSGVSAASPFHLNGSDTLHDVTVDVINGCNGTFSDFNSKFLTYDGGGSGVGAGQLGQGAQALAPMSRALKPGAGGEYCAVAAQVYSTGTVTSSPSLTEALLVGIDGVAIAANTTNSCSSSSATQFGATSGFQVFNDGLTGTPATCPGCSGTTYTFGDTSGTIYSGQPSFDALAVLYFGLTHDGTYNCASPVRKSLIKNWNNLFTGGCAAGKGNCPNGLSHAWRRSDLSGTTDAFVSVLNPPNNSAGFSVGIGTLSTVPVGASQKSNPFCNSVDQTGTTIVKSFGGSSDFSDNDPVRTNCAAPETAVPPPLDSSGNPTLSTNTDDVCEAFKNFATSQKVVGGDIGVVVPILVPDEVTQNTAEWYPSVPCSGSCTLVQVAKNLPAGFLCPNGLKPYATQCFMPFAGSASNPDPRCVSGPNNTCVDTVGKRDGREYNLVTIVAGSEIQNSTIKKIALDFAGGPFQFALDANIRLLTGSYYRMRSVNGADPTNATTPPTGTGICQENDDTSQIGCLVDSDKCSVGFAGRKAASAFSDTPGPGGQSALKALSVNGTPPFTPGGNQDLALQNLLQPTGTTPLYPLARRLYVSTLYGWDNLQGGEKELAECYGNSTTVGGHITDEGFVAVPGGIQCLDYPETASASISPLPNVQGVGSVALGGCGSSTENNACVNHPLTGTGVSVSVCGDSVVNPAAGEQCDPPNGTTCDNNCRTIP
jgi:hypothetical protein